MDVGADFVLNICRAAGIECPSPAADARRLTDALCWIDLRRRIRTNAGRGGGFIAYPEPKNEPYEIVAAMDEIKGGTYAEIAR